MLDTLRRGQRWLTGLFVLVVGGVFVVFIGLGGPLRGRHAASTLVKVGPYEYGRETFERVRERREAADPGEASARATTPAPCGTRSTSSRSRRWSTAPCSRSRPRRWASKVAKQEIERVVRSAGIFRGEDGRFDRAAYQRYAEYEFGNEHNFVEEQRQGLLATKLIRLLTSQARVSEAEAREAVRQQPGIRPDRGGGPRCHDPARGPRDHARAGPRRCSAAGRPPPRRSTSSGSRPTTSPSRSTPATSCCGSSPGRPPRRSPSARSRRRRCARAWWPARTSRSSPLGLRRPRLEGVRRRPRILQARPDGEAVRGRGLRAPARRAVARLPLRFRLPRAARRGTQGRRSCARSTR